MISTGIWPKSRAKYLNASIIKVSSHTWGWNIKITTNSLPVSTFVWNKLHIKNLTDLLFAFTLNFAAWAADELKNHRLALFQVVSVTCTNCYWQFWFPSNPSSQIPRFQEYLTMHDNNWYKKMRQKFNYYCSFSLKQYIESANHIILCETFLQTTKSSVLNHVAF